MIIKKFKLFEGLDPWSRRVNRSINYNKIREDINGILIELKDIGYNINVSSNEESFDHFGINISNGVNHVSTFDIREIRDYLDTCVDYMSMYYNYKIEVKYTLPFSGKDYEFDNYELPLKALLDKGVTRFKSFILIFYDITVK